MTKTIEIQIERHNLGDWINIFIPYSSAEKMFAVMQNEQGDRLKMVILKEGNNAIDISNINNSTINLKVETPYETVLKKLKIHQ